MPAPARRHGQRQSGAAREWPAERRRRACRWRQRRQQVGRAASIGAPRAPPGMLALDLRPIYAYRPAEALAQGRAATAALTAHTACMVARSAAEGGASATNCRSRPQLTGGSPIPSDAVPRCGGGTGGFKCRRQGQLMSG